MPESPSPTNSSTPHMPHHIFQKNDSQQKNDPVTTHVLPCTVSSKRSIPHSLQEFNFWTFWMQKKKFRVSWNNFQKNDSTPSERFYSMRTILLHEKDSTPWERFHCMRTILLWESNALENLETNFSHPDAPQASLLFKLYNWWPGRKFWWHCDNPQETGKAKYSTAGLFFW